MSVARKKRINEQCQHYKLEVEKQKKSKSIDGDKDATDSGPNTMSRNWAMAGFFDATSTYETIRTEEPPSTQAPMPYACNLPPRPERSNMLSRRLTRELTSGEITYGDIVVGDVYEEVRKPHLKHGPLHLYKVLEVYPQSRSALFETAFGKEKKKWAEMLDETKYHLIVTEEDTLHGTKKKRHFQAQQSVRVPYQVEQAKYSGQEAKTGLFTLFRHTPMDIPHPTQPLPSLKCGDITRSEGTAPPLSTLTLPPSPSQPTHPTLSHPLPPPPCPSQLTPRLAYIRACQRQALPPIPLLCKCFDDSYPVLSLAGQSVGSRFCAALAEALPMMHFLREVNFSANRLDSRSSPIIIECLHTTGIESIILDDNRIGKSGVMALIALVSNTLNHEDKSQSQYRKSMCTSTADSPLLPPLSLPHGQVAVSGGGEGGRSAKAMGKPNNTKTRDVSSAPPPDGVFSASVGPFRLTKLSVNGNEIGDTLVAKLVRSLSQNCPDLQHLGLRDNKCSKFTAKAVQKMLSNPACQVEYLDLSWNELKTQGCREVLGALRSNTTLQYLHLDWNGIGVEVVPVLKEIVSYDGSGLQAITLLHNHISESLLSQIEASIKNTKQKTIRLNAEVLGGIK